MRTARYYIRILGFGAFSLGLSYAGEPSGQPAEKPPHGHASAGIPPGNSAEAKRDQADRPHAGTVNNSAGLAKNSATAPVIAPVKREPSSRPQPPVLNKPATAPNRGLIIDANSVRQELPAKLPVAAGTTAQSPVAFRGRSDLPAVLGGKPTVIAKTSVAVLDGTGMKRKP
jgi:hypothetical protein